MRNVVRTSVVPRTAALLLALSSALVLASLAACGQKGPLVPATAVTKAPTAAPAASASPAGVR